MRLEKIILRAVLSTLAAIAVLFTFMILTLCFIYPSTMMQITYNLGMDESSIKYATRAYNRSDAIEYIAHATEVAIGLEDNEKILSCGEQFIKDEEFADYCIRKNERFSASATVTGTYEQYIYGSVCVAEYKEGKKAESVTRAFDLIGQAYPINNAAAAVLASAIALQDTDTIALILEKMQGIAVETLSEQDRAYFEKMMMVINGQMDGAS